MAERILEEPIELIDADLDLVSGGTQSLNGAMHEEMHEQSDTINKNGHPRHENEPTGIPGPF